MDAIRHEVVYLFYIDFKAVQYEDSRLNYRWGTSREMERWSLPKCRFSLPDTVFTTQEELRVVMLGSGTMGKQILLYSEEIESLNGRNSGLFGLDSQLRVFLSILWYSVNLLSSVWS